MAKIYQLNWKETNNDLFFKLDCRNEGELNGETVKAVQQAITQGLYEYKGTIEGISLEGAFMMMQGDFRPDIVSEKFGRMRSLSVRDIVVIEGRTFLCCGFGWCIINIEMPQPTPEIIVTKEDIETEIQNKKDKVELLEEPLDWC